MRFASRSSPLMHAQRAHIFGDVVEDVQGTRDRCLARGAWDVTEHTRYLRKLAVDRGYNVRTL